MNAVVFASWTPYIPQVQSRLGGNDAAMGDALLGMSIGSIAATVVVGKLLPRFGSHRIIRISVVGYAGLGFLVGTVRSLPELFAALVVWGSCQGALDVAMNTQAVTVQHAIGRQLLPRWHGMWSVGGLAGALLGTEAIGAGMPLWAVLLAIGIVGLVAMKTFSRSLIDDSSHPSTGNAKGGSSTMAIRSIFSITVLALGSIALMSMLCEGVAADWSANYLRNDLHTDARFGGLGFASFTAAMAGMRFVGSALLRKYSVRLLLPLCAVVSILGMTAALLVAHPMVGLVGFAALGIGVALVVPTMFGAAGSYGASNTPSGVGPAVAATSGLGWLGYVAGPPLIGRLADMFGLAAALWLVPALMSVIAIAIACHPIFRRSPRGSTRRETGSTEKWNQSDSKTVTEMR